MFSLCGGIGPLVALLARPHRGARKSTAGRSASISSATRCWRVCLRLLRHGAERRPARRRSIAAGDAAGAGAGPAAAPALAALTQPVGRRAERRGATTFMRLAFGAGARILPARSRPASPSAATHYHEGSVSISPGSCRSSATCGPRSRRRPRRRSTPMPAPSRRLADSRVLAGPVLLIPLIGFGLLRVQPTRRSRRLLPPAADDDGDGRGPGVLTLRLSVQSGELQRADARLRLLAAATEQTADLILITRADGRSSTPTTPACTRSATPATSCAARTCRPARTRLRADGRSHRLRGAAEGHLARHARAPAQGRQHFPASSTVVALERPDGRITHFVGVQRDITDELSCAISSCTASGSRRSASWSPASRTRSTTRCRRSSAASSC